MHLLNVMWAVFLIAFCCVALFVGSTRIADWSAELIIWIIDSKIAGQLSERIGMAVVRAGAWLMSMGDKYALVVFLPRHEGADGKRRELEKAIEAMVEERLEKS